MGSPPNPTPGWLHGMAQGAKGQPSGSPNFASVNGHANSAGGGATASPPSAAANARWDPMPVVGDFPEGVWLDAFELYRDTMHNTSSAPDAVHFMSFWAAAGVRLGRTVRVFQGIPVYANIAGVFCGPTGDSKTTGQRGLFYNDLLKGVSVIEAAGSAEGLADAFAGLPGGGGAFFLYLEELCELLVRASWSGSAIDGLLIRCLDCPESYDLLYRKKPIHIVRPTPTVLAATTAEYFWRHVSPDFFYGGLGNRYVFFVGKQKAPLPVPSPPAQAGIVAVRKALKDLGNLPSSTTEVKFDAPAEKLWAEYYCDFEQRAFRPLLRAATRRMRTYTVKLAMVYAALQKTLPSITLDQLNAAIKVSDYACRSVGYLIDQQTAPGTGSEIETAEFLLEYIHDHDGIEYRKLHNNASRKVGGAEKFNRLLDNLRHAERIDVRKAGKLDPKKVYYIG